MNKLSQAAAVVLTLFVLGCTEQDSYPVSGEECGPNDPVKEMTIPDCGPTVN